MSRVLEALKQLDARQPPAPAPAAPSEAAPAAASETPEADRLRRGSPDPAETAEPLARPEGRPQRFAAPSPEYVELAGNVLARLTAGRPAVLLFAGAHASADAPQIVAPLAATLAQRVPENILVVGRHFDRPAVRGPKGRHGRRSLVDVLAGEAHWRDAVLHTDQDNVHVLPGDPFPTPDDVLPEGASLAALLGELRPHFRLVLVEAGSLAHPGAARLSRYCDATYLVVQLHRTPQRAARRAIEQVERSGGLVAGCIVTNA
jgi:hypothetical protein